MYKIFSNSIYNKFVQVGVYFISKYLIIINTLFSYHSLYQPSTNIIRLKLESRADPGCDMEKGTMYYSLFTTLLFYNYDSIILFHVLHLSLQFWNILMQQQKSLKIWTKKLQKHTGSDWTDFWNIEEKVPIASFWTEDMPRPSSRIHNCYLYPTQHRHRQTGHSSQLQHLRP